mgnify:CR=1 FL=1
MPTPRLDDDGATVTLDLHGATVDEALDLSVRTVELAARRGRASVRLVHGSSTTRHDPHRRTIKRALHALLDEGGLHPAATQALRMEDVLVLSLDVTTAPDPTPIRLRDVV